MSKWNEYLIAYKNKHQDKYDYSDTIFTKVKDKIRIYCNVHKVHFEQVARDHLTGTACIHCKSELIGSGNKARIKTDNSYLIEMNKLLRWTRQSDDSPLFLEVFENNKWIHYKQSRFYVPDAKMSSNSGFGTAQKYLSLGYKYEVTQND